MARNKNDYFDLIKRQVEYCSQAADLLEKMLCNFSVPTVPTYRTQMHEIEHKADELHHDICTRLSAEFITPIDQEDILRLVQIIDDITDALDEVTLDFYMYHVDELPLGADAFSKIVNRCVKSLLQAVSELKNFKKPANLRRLLVDVNTIESEADEVCTESIYKIFASTNDAKLLIGSKAIYDSMENCCDLCEHAADVIEQIIIKNT